MAAATPAGIFDPATHQMAALREVLCAPAYDPDVPALALSDDELTYFVDALHTIENSAGYLAYWCQMDAEETSALGTIRETVAALLGAFSA